jgi:hypothetical protein
MARHRHFGSLQRERVFDYRRALSDGAIVRRRNENRPEPMAYSHGALSHFYWTADELRAASLNPTDSHYWIVMEAVAHLLSQSVIAAKTLAQHQLGNGGNVCRFKNSLGQGFRHLSPPERPPN